MYGDMGDDVVYIQPPDWWPEPVPEGHVFLLLKSIYGTCQAARFKPEDASELPDPLKQKYYRSFVAKLQFAATWIRFDISFAVSQLARYCASAGTPQWAALHHLMEYMSNHLSVKITYRRGAKLVDFLSGYADADWGYISSSMSTSGMVMLYNK